jgi:hypothetical protein
VENVLVVKLSALNVYPFRFNVPRSKVVGLTSCVEKSDTNVHDVLLAANLGDRTRTFLVSIVCVPATVKFNVPDWVHTAVASNVKPPMATAVVPANVTVPAVFVMANAVRLPVPLNVTVYVAAWSNMATSAAVGTEAPDAPPLVADQFVVDVASHVPVPPTQYLFAIT